MIIKEFNFFRSKSNALKDVYDKVKNDPEFSNVEMVDKKDNEHINFDFKKRKMTIMSDSINLVLFHLSGLFLGEELIINYN